MRMTRVDPAVGKTKGTMENWRETFLKWYVHDKSSRKIGVKKVLIIRT